MNKRCWGSFLTDFSGTAKSWMGWLLKLTGATLLLAQVSLVVAGVVSPPDISFNKTFSPDTIAPGSVTELKFDISNAGSGVVDSIDFTDNLPAGVEIATPANAQTTCGGTLTAPDGGGTISLADGVLGAASTCAVTVNVTASTAGFYSNTTSSLSSSAGVTPPASDDLNVSASLPGFSKSFNPSVVPLGSRSRLTFTIDNSANGAALTSLNFADNFPSGLLIASPANLNNSCGHPSHPGTITATPGTNKLVYSHFGNFSYPSSLAAGAVCTLSVDVVATGVGMLGNVTDELITDIGSSGKSSAVLEVTADSLALSKEFLDDPVPAGSSVTLEFTLRNTDRDEIASNIAFSDDLDATLSGLVAMDLPVADICGVGSLLSGTSLLSLTGASLGPGELCTFSVDLQIPVAAGSGVFNNLTSNVTGDIASIGVVGASASDDLFVEPAPVLTKVFLDNPVGAGSTTELEFTITNTSTTSDATDIAFEDELPVILPTAVTVPSPGFCGNGAIALFTPGSGFGPPTLSVSGASLSESGTVGDSCTFSVVLNVATGAATGSYLNTTGVIAAQLPVDEISVTGNPASDTLEVVAAPRLEKEFTDDPAQPGSTVNLNFTLTHDANAPGDATNISFTDDLTAVLGTLAATGLPQNDICGPGSQISGTGTLSFSGGTLAPGDSCSFDVTLSVPASATPGAYTNSTSAVSATVLGLATTENGATDDLNIAGLMLQKEFLADPVVPGGTVDLQFTISNTSPGSDATSIDFTDDLDETLSGLSVSAGELPLNNLCGAGSSLIESSNTLVFTGGSVNATQSCTFSVTLDVPLSAASNIYGNTTSQMSATVEGGTLFFDPASDQLTVSSDQLSLTKEFTDDPVAPGDSVILEFTLTNLDATQAASNIAFTDDLESALSGLVATGLPLNNICGAGSALSGTSTLGLTGGNLPAGGSCTFSVTLNVPALAPLGSVITNQSSGLTGTINGLAVTGLPASDDLLIDFISLSKAFDGPVPQSGGTAVLSFTVQNRDAVHTVQGISFTDNLAAVLPGLVATGLPVNGVCGASSQISGTSVLNFVGGQLPPSGSCSFDVTVTIPAASNAGDHNNVTSGVSVSGQPAGSPASAALTIDPPPVITPPAGIVQEGIGPLTPVNLGAGSALDLLDGPLPATPDQVGPFPLGLTVVNWQATDGFGQIGTATQNVTIVDTTSPTISLLGSDPVVVDQGDPFVDPGATASDLVDGDLTGSINVTGLPDTNVTGVYTVTYQVQDLSGNSNSVQRTVNVGVRSFVGLLPSGNIGNLALTSADPNCEFQSTPGFLAESDLTIPPPPQVTVFDGMASFTIVNCAVGATVQLTLDYGQPVPAGSQVWKEGFPWFVVPSSVSGNQISWFVTDGGLGDADGAVNGSITDPAGAAIAVVLPVPVLTLGAWLLLVLSMGGVGLRFRKSA